MKARLLGRIRCLGGVAVVCVGAALAMGAPAASATEIEKCTTITGSGSSLQNLAQKEVWTKDWTSVPWATELRSEIKCKEAAETSVTYEPTSSGKGLGEWGSKNGTLTPSESFNKEKLDEFVGTDVGPEGPATTSGTQMFEMDEAGKSATEKNKVTAFPVAQSAISIIVSLPVGCTPSGTGATVKLTSLTKQWYLDNEPFTSLISGVTFTGASCSEDPILEAREAPSGTTAGFKRYLADLAPTEGNAGFTYEDCTKTAVLAESPECWPEASNKVETGNETGGKLAEKVYNTPRAEGYADLADARKFFKAEAGTFEVHTNAKSETYYSAILLVPNGTVATEGTKKENPEVVAAGEEHEGSNCKLASYPLPGHVAPNEDWSKAKQSNATADEAGVYPICTLTFDVAWQRYASVKWINAKTSLEEKYSKEQYGTTFSYLRAVVTKGQATAVQKVIAEKHFLGLPKKLVEEDEEGVTRKNIFFETENK